MTHDKWLDLKDKIKDRFEIEKQEKDTLDDVPDAVIERLIFTSLLGKIKLEWISKPKTLGEHTTYSNRIGSNVKVDKIYSEDERSEFLKVYKFENENWEEISTNDFNF